MRQFPSSILKHVAAVLQQQQGQLFGTCPISLAWSVSKMQCLHISTSNGLFCSSLQSLSSQQQHVAGLPPKCHPYSSIRVHSSSMAYSQACCTRRCLQNSSSSITNTSSSCTKLHAMSQANSRSPFLSHVPSPIPQQASAQHMHWSTRPAASIVTRGFSSKSRASSGGFSKSSKPKVQYECQKCGAGKPLLLHCSHVKYCCCCGNAASFWHQCSGHVVPLFSLSLQSVHSCTAAANQ